MQQTRASIFRTTIASAILISSLCSLPAHSDVVWTTNPDLPTTFSAFLAGPSAITPVINSEVADDFNVIGTIEHIIADGEDCNQGCFGGQPVTGVYMRFYEWTSSGPGALQQEIFIEESDPGFVWTPCCGPERLDITLPQPFEATGWHFVSVQVAIDGTALADQWNFHRTNIGGPMGLPAYIRDLDANGAWVTFHSTTGWPASDVSFQLDGEIIEVPAADIIEVFGTPTNPSGRLRITGDNFGDEQLDNSILINDLEAIVTQWTDETIIAYVPEETVVGDATLEFIVNDVVADSVDFTVEPREQVGKVLWRFAVDDDYMAHRPAVGPDGTLYLHDLHGKLYALSSDGGLQWIVDALRGQIGLGAEGRTVVGEDGTIYLVVNPLGPTTDVVAYTADGTLRWEFIEPDSWGIAAGPAIGPDGNLYVAFYDADQFSYGITSFTPEGAVRWNNNGNPPLYEHGAFGVELVFGASQIGGETDQVVLTVDRASDPWLYTFDMENGSQNWAIPRGVTADPFLQLQIEPNTGPDGTIYMTEFIGFGGLGWGLNAYDPSDGDLLWRYDPNIISGASGPDIGSDGIIYFSYDISRVGAVFPDGTEKWTHIDFGGIRTMPRVSPNNDVVLVGGGEFGEPGFIKLIDAATGDEIWKETLPNEAGDINPDASALFTDDGSRAYFPTSQIADPEPFQYCYMYALEVLESAPLIGDLDGDDAVAFSDLLTLLAAWGECEESCAADLDASGDVGFADLLLLLSNWT